VASGNFQSVKVVARVLILSERRVQKLVSEGILPRPARGMYDLIDCVMAYIRYQRKLIDEKPQAGVSAIEAERTRLTGAKAGLAELDERERRGELIPSAQIETFISTIFSRVRQGVLSLASRAAPQAYDAKSIPEVQKIITDCCEDALKEISETRIDFKAIDPGGAAARAHRARGASDSTPAA